MGDSLEDSCTVDLHANRRKGRCSSQSCCLTSQHFKIMLIRVELNKTICLGMVPRCIYFLYSQNFAQDLRGSLHLCLTTIPPVHHVCIPQSCSTNSLVIVAVTGRKRTLSTLTGLVMSLECFVEIIPDFLYPFMND